MPYAAATFQSTGGVDAVDDLVGGGERVGRAERGAAHRAPGGLPRRAAVLWARPVPDRGRPASAGGVGRALRRLPAERRRRARTARRGAHRGPAAARDRRLAARLPRLGAGGARHLRARREGEPRADLGPRPAHRRGGDGDRGGGADGAARALGGPRGHRPRVAAGARGERSGRRLPRRELLARGPRGPALAGRRPPVRGGERRVQPDRHPVVGSRAGDRVAFY